MAKTDIEYADQVSNPLMARPIGDESVKIGTFCEKPDAKGTCKNCWAEILNMRFGNKFAFDNSNRDKIEWKFRYKELARMERLNAAKPMSEKFPGLPLVVFCFDTFDIFQPSISDKKRDVIFDFYDKLANLTLLVQTTYPAKMSRYFRERYGADGLPNHYWVGMSAGTQKFYDDNYRYLKQVKAKEKYVIFEPLLEQIEFDVPQMLHDANVNKQPHFTFTIVGGESGHKARACDIGWIRLIVGQCKAAGAKCFVKQLGAKPSERQRDYELPNGKKIPFWGPLRLKDKKGGDISEFPKDLQIREMPENKL